MRKRDLIFYNFKYPYLYDNDKKVDENDECYLILQKYKIPKFLDNVKVVKQTLKEADNNLIYIARDKNNKLQYIYGNTYVINRRKNKLNSFLKIEDKRKHINKYLNDNKIIIDDDKKNLTIESIIALIISLEFKFFIRTGRLKYSNENNTTGILTLKRKHLTINNDNINLEFIGKKGIIGKFIISKCFDEYIYDFLFFLYKECKDDDSFIFSFNGKFIGEHALYKTLKKLGITLKEIRTYGSNLIMIQELWKYLNSLDDISSFITRKTNIKRTISRVLETTADTIGHSKSISRKSYIIDYLSNENYMDIIIKNFNSNYEFFYKYIIKKLREWKE